MVAISLLSREMGPVIRIMRRKIGSSMGAELGSMRVTEQIDALEVFFAQESDKIFNCTKSFGKHL
jgi:ABC-type transporter Mla maintaining outer membrane lipid asymmetry permease subunit MlaE